jgi:hypothetical protein
MNKRQTSIVRHFLVVIAVTLAVIFGLINLRDTVNKSEAIREMGVLARTIQDYRHKNGSLPSEAFLKPVIGGFSRTSNLQYRAQHVLYDSPADTIVAYSKRRSYSFLVKSGYVYIQFDGQVKWMPPAPFEQMLARQDNERSRELNRLYGEHGD